MSCKQQIKVGLVQFETCVNDYKGNLERALEKVKQGAEQGCKLICLPEAFSTTIDLKGIKEIS